MNLGEYLKQATGPTLGTEREGSRYIDIGDLVADERNFYELSGIDALAANIELIGLQQPIRVREAGGKFRIVSGHRRRAAIQKLVDEGREDLRSVHCIVETVECSEAMQELRLIYANSDTRKMSSADLSRQAERVYTAELLPANNAWEQGLTADEVRAAFSMITVEWVSGDN